ncbi:Crp/Fnr family transcriptional regulator [Pedobacter chitinilyticus]|uniref:Crp/Fnr family transcriptional regulator n=1 Tax=Pedobacter chitinilyticus TaxID=2233776 RepID=UPI001969126A|nr:Crp/Fnr family transcriptional regulator [Pedobacter chitinilyticus]
MAYKVTTLNTISNQIDSILPLPAVEKELLLSRLQRIEVAKGKLIISAGKIGHHVYFIEGGLARAFCENQRGQTTIWFGQEGDVMLSYLSFFKDQPGYESIELLENAVLYRISSKDLQELYRQHIHIANWGRKFAEYELLKAEQRFMDLQFKTATERYQDLLVNSPAILKRVQLGYIASYLGITQVSLSRIRAAIK